MKEYLIPACSGASLNLAKGQTIAVIDVEGGQVADFFAERTEAPREFLSSAVTMTATNPSNFMWAISST